jgi:hypothetical protein
LLNDIYGRLPGVLGFELDVLPVNDYYFYRSLMRAQKNVDASPTILKLRMNKSDWEIQQMEKTAELTRKTFEYMQKTIRPDLSEMEFAAMAETYARKLGHSGRIRARPKAIPGTLSAEKTAPGWDSWMPSPVAKALRRHFRWVPATKNLNAMNRS